MNKQLRVLTALNVIVSVVSVNGGWTTIKFPDGSESKARNGALRELTPEELEAHKSAGKTEKPAKKQPAAKPARAERHVDESEEGVDNTPTDSLVNPDYSRYIKHEVKSPSGRRALDIGDAAADALRGQDISDCYFIVAKHMARVKGEERTADQIEQELKTQYEHLNIGMQRMNLGNRLRKVMGIYGNLNAHKSKKPRSMPAKIGRSRNSASISIPVRLLVPKSSKLAQMALFEAAAPAKSGRKSRR